MSQPRRGERNGVRRTPMLGRNQIAGCLAALLLLLAPAFTQSRYGSPQQGTRQPSRPPQQRMQPNPGRFGGPPQRNQFPQNQTPRNQPPRNQRPPNQPGHAGNWLRSYKDLPPAQQRRALENDPQFRRLPPPQQRQLQNRLQHFSNLPPQQPERMPRR